MNTPAFVGVDNGGTWIRLVGLDSQGRRAWSFKKPSPTVPHLPAFLRHQLKRFHGRLEGLAVGSRGVWKIAKRQSVKGKLRGLAKKIVVMSDVEAAWLAAFTSQGVVVISGTGSIAYGRTPAGRSARAGGLGPEKGDEGSGYWIGKEWLRRNGNPVTFKRANVRRVAALAPKVLARARRKDPTATRIVQEAQAQLAELVGKLARKLRLKPFPIYCAGSVFQNAGFRRGFLRALAPRRVRVRTPSRDAATALARSIM